jgi:hypothetical protein
MPQWVCSWLGIIVSLLAARIHGEQSAQDVVDVHQPGPVGVVANG